MRDGHPTLEQHVSAAIVAAEQVYQEPRWRAWATDWLSGADRSVDSARAAMAVANVEIEAAMGSLSTPPSAVAAAAARLASQLAVGISTAAELRRTGQTDLAHTFEDMTATMAEIACRVSLRAT
jgi:hypothetical protein